jgi:hypothetical protein
MLADEERRSQFCSILWIVRHFMHHQAKDKFMSPESIADHPERITRVYDVQEF